MPGYTLEESNAALRAVVEKRLKGGILDEGEDMVLPADIAQAADDVADVASAISRSASKHPSSRAFLNLLDEMRRLHESKSADYGSTTDPLANIRQGAEFVNIEHWRGCMVRIADKVQRLRTYCQTGRLVHEGVRDTLLDLSAYSLLAIVLFDEQQNA